VRGPTKDAQPKGHSPIPKTSSKRTWSNCFKCKGPPLLILRPQFNIKIALRGLSTATHMQDSVGLETAEMIHEGNAAQNTLWNARAFSPFAAILCSHRGGLSGGATVPEFPQAMAFLAGETDVPSVPQPPESFATGSSGRPCTAACAAGGWMTHGFRFAWRNCANEQAPNGRRSDWRKNDHEGTRGSASVPRVSALCRQSGSTSPAGHSGQRPPNPKNQKQTNTTSSANDDSTKPSV
jgi:hypothetical protein